ncbi:MAG TPA: alpha/beta hydrolase [Candidatus Binataceae bacterium]|nr:alpha/beta hydrolase [Candidatus Binataceae bacterium]
MPQEPAATAAAAPISRYAQLNGLRLHYFDWGGDAADRIFVLCHGGSAHAHWWDHVAPQLNRYGRVLALDLRGHGLSTWTEVYGAGNHISDVKAFLRDHLGRPVVLVGHSMGGEVAQRVTADCPELVIALILVDSPHGGPPLLTRLKWRWKWRKQHLGRPEFRTPEELVRRFRLSPPGDNLSRERLADLALKGAERLPNGNWAFRFDPKTRKMLPGWKRHLRFPLKNIRVPTLILRGEHSTLLTARVARTMHRRIPGSRFKQIPDAHHHVPLDNPAATAAAIIEFVEILDESTPSRASSLS